MLVGARAERLRSLDPGFSELSDPPEYGGLHGRNGLHGQTPLCFV